MPKDAQLLIFNGMIKSSGRVMLNDLARLTRASRDYWLKYVYERIGDGRFEGYIENEIYYVKPADKILSYEKFQ